MDERTRKKLEAVTGDDFHGWTVDDMRYVKKNPPNGKERSIDDMLSILSKRVDKNGCLDEYEENQYYTKPSEERRQAKEEREYMLDQKLDRD